jgi:putative hemolysin
MLRHLVRVVCAVGVAAAVWLGSGVIANAATFGPAPNSEAIGDSLAASYCTQTGGEPVKRVPVYGSNASSLLFLSGTKTFCKYTSASDGSRIHILIETLYTKKPSLAALAYYAAPALGKGCNGNPASCYCTQLGGSDVFGGANDPAGGGWYNQNDYPDQTLEACIFPDMSSIDSWGLAYHSAGIIRGVDLSTVMRYPNPFTNKKR